MRSRTTRAFQNALRSLPKQVQDQARTAYDKFQADSNNPGLQFRRVGRRREYCTVRISDNYRALGTWRGDSVLWWWIGPHHEYDRILKLL